MDLFVYGTLMVPEVMYGVCGFSVPGLPAVLHDYRRRCVVGERYPAIVDCPGDRVPGLVYPGITPRALRLLDAFEGEMYRRRPVKVRTGSTLRTVHSYVLDPGYHHALGHEPWSLEAFEAEGLKEFLVGYAGFAQAAAEGDRDGQR